MKCHLAVGKEPELVLEVEQYQLELVRLTSTHSLDSGYQLPKKGWTLFYSVVAYSEMGLCLGTPSPSTEGDFNAHMGSGSDTWRGMTVRYVLPYLNPSWFCYWTL